MFVVGALRRPRGQRQRNDALWLWKEYRWAEGLIGYKNRKAWCMAGDKGCMAIPRSRAGVGLRAQGIEGQTGRQSGPGCYGVECKGN